MSPVVPQSIDSHTRALCDAGEFDAATEAALRGYGSEILGFLVGVLRDSVAADDAFAQFAEDLWRGLPSFQWRASLRTWSYVVARRAMARTSRNAARHERRAVPLSNAPQLAAVVEHMRTTTQLHLRSEVKDAMAQIRAQLDETDRTLLILRIDRRLSWREVAAVMTHEPLDDDALDRKAAQLRKQLERLKGRLRELAAQAGIVSS